jgi:hypothetical protein
VPSGPDPRRVEVRIPGRIWAEEVERLRAGSSVRVAAERERRRLERDGLSLRELIACDPAGPDGTRLPGLFKVYVPISAEPASRRPFGFVFSPGIEDGRLYLALVAYGERHPRPGTRAVYERAHRHLHGRFPSQEPTAAETPARSPRVHSPSRGVGRAQDRGGLQR